MAENMNPDKTAAHDRIETVDLQVEMARSYLDYAMSVIVGRALGWVGCPVAPTS